MNRIAKQLREIERQVRSMQKTSGKGIQYTIFSRNSTDTVYGAAEVEIGMGDLDVVVKEAAQFKHLVNYDLKSRAKNNSLKVNKADLQKISISSEKRQSLLLRVAFYVTLSGEGDFQSRIKDFEFSLGRN